MPSSSESLPPDWKRAALVRIQSQLDLRERPTALACGLSEEMFRVLANEGLIECIRVRDEGPLLEQWRIEKISEAGFAILSWAGPVAVPVQLRDSPVSPARRIVRVLGKTLLELLKVGFAIWLGWWLKSRFP